MPELEILESLANLPINIIFIGVIIHLYRKIDVLQKEHNTEIKEQQAKYEDVLKELASLRGRVDAEIAVEQKIDKIIDVISKRTK
jgi:hypothetical protein